jgi:hypothetical protein
VHLRETTLAVLAVCAAAILPYLTTIDDYFVRDDFGVVQLLASKPPMYFPRWFYTSWMDQIWGFTPDEVRPFPAVSYQLTALGGAASPVLHHLLNILIHAANGLLVFAIARTAAALSLPAATLAAVAFGLLPAHAESVAWITGRVDSMPAFFYLASFLAYARWRLGGSQSTQFYGCSVLLFFVALFTKQNTITMVGTLLAYDVVRLRRSWGPFASFLRPYVPYVILTAGYLWLRYVLFGQVAREGSLNTQGFRDFAVLFQRHLTHVMTGSIDGSPLLVWVTLGTAFVLSIEADHQRRSNMVYFGPIWWLIGVAPVAVAGYASPRHVYLAAVGWAIILGTAFDIVRQRYTSVPARRIAAICAISLIAAYLMPLRHSVRDWSTIASVSQKAVRDVRAAALAAPEGTLLVVGAPVRSWEWALPFAVRPPFVRTDLTERVFVVSPRALSCCGGQWFDETREALRRWSSGAKPESVVVLRWDEQSGALSRATTADAPQLSVLIRALPDLKRPQDLDTNLRRILQELTVKIE